MCSICQIKTLFCNTVQLTVQNIIFCTNVKLFVHPSNCPLTISLSLSSCVHSSLVQIVCVHACVRCSGVRMDVEETGTGQMEAAAQEEEAPAPKRSRGRPRKQPQVREMQ